MSSFNIDLTRGQEIEEKWFNILKSTIKDLVHVKGKEKKWDLYSKDRNIGIEIKYDPKSQDTGNIVVEIEMPPGNPSGLSTTRARYWIFDTGVESFIVPTVDLHKLLSKHKPVVFTGPKDYYSKKAYLIRKEYISNISISIDEMYSRIPLGLGGFF